VKLKKISIVVLVFLIFWGVFLPIPAGFLKKDIKNAFKKQGYLIKNLDVSVKLTGKVTISDLIMSNGSSDKFEIKKLEIYGSLLKIRSFKKSLPTLVLTRYNFIPEISKPLKKIVVSGISMESFSSLFGFSGIDGVFKLSSKEMNGKFSVKSAHYDSYKLGKQKCRFKMNYEGLSLKLTKGEFAKGVIKADASLSFADTTLYDINIMASNLKVSELANSNKIDGEVSVKFKGEKFAINSSQLFGEGKVTIDNFKESGYRDLGAALRAFKLLGINSLNFDKIEFPFVASGDKISSDKVVAKRKGTEIIGNGYTKVKNQYFNYEIEGYLDSSLEKDVTTVIWDALLPTENGGKKFKGRVKGVVKNYTVLVDKDLMKRSINSFFTNLFN
jgi:hypothetical protein